MNANDDQLPDEILNPEQIIDEIDSAMEEAQNIYSHRATLMGEQREIVQGTRDFWKALGDEGVEVETVSSESIYTSGVKALSASRYEIQGLLANLKQTNEESERVARLASGTAIIAASTSSAVESVIRYELPKT